MIYVPPEEQILITLWLRTTWRTNNYHAI